MQEKWRVLVKMSSFGVNTDLGQRASPSNKTSSLEEGVVLMTLLRGSLVSSPTWPLPVGTTASQLVPGTECIVSVRLREVEKSGLSSTLVRPSWGAKYGGEGGLSLPNHSPLWWGSEILASAVVRVAGGRTWKCAVAAETESQRSRGAYGTRQWCPPV